VLDLGSILRGEVVEFGPDAVNQTADPANLLSGRKGLRARPLVGIDRSGEDTFPVAEQVGQVRLQIGQVRRIRAEVAAADAPEPDRAGIAAGGNVAGFAASTVRDSDLADG